MFQQCILRLVVEEKQGAGDVEFRNTRRGLIIVSVDLAVLLVAAGLTAFASSRKPLHQGFEHFAKSL